MGLTANVLRAIRLAKTQFYEGLKAGYPLCCIFNFYVDEVFHRYKQRIKRHVPDLPHGGYVPCVLCCWARHHSYQRRITQLFLDTSMLDKKDFRLLPDNVKTLVTKTVPL